MAALFITAKKLEATQITTNRRISSYIVVYWYNWIEYRWENSMNYIIKYINIDESQKLWEIKEQVREEYILFDIFYIILKTEKNISETNQYIV